MLDDLPADPAALDKAVLAGIPYRYDWELYNMPWYFPTIEEILERGEGDCKARAPVLASVLEAKGLPYRVNSSPIHVWVEYDGKVETSVENPQVQLYQRDPETGEAEFQLPEIRLNEVVDSGWRAFWSPMPDGRKALLLSGLLALITARVVLRKRRGARQEATPDIASRPDTAS